MPQILLLKLAGEISLKSKPVQNRFYATLLNNIRTALRNNSITDFEVKRGYGRIFLSCQDPEKTISVLKSVFGLHSIAIAKKYENAIPKNIYSKTLTFARIKLKRGDSFAVRCNRVGNHGYSSQQINQGAGEKILKEINELKVNLKNPDKEIFIEIRNDDFYLYSSESNGYNGLPVGVEGHVGILCNNKEEDLLAALCMLKRGCSIYCIIKEPVDEHFFDPIVKFNSYQKIKFFEFDSIKNTDPQKQKMVALVDPSMELDLKRIAGQDKDMFLPVFRPLLFMPEDKISELRRMIYND